MAGECWDVDHDFCMVLDVIHSEVIAHYPPVRQRKF